MRKIVLQFTTIAIILLLGACSNEEILDENDGNPALQTGRTLSLLATMPGDKSDEPTTRVDLGQQADKSILLTWEKTDEVQIAFVQGEGEVTIKIKSTAKVTTISPDGKMAQFDIIIPEEINDGAFDLYGVYGGGGLDVNDPTKVILPTNPSEATSLAAIKERKDVMLHFASKDIQTADPQVSVDFHHLGSIFSITVKNTFTTSIDNLAEARLVGPEGGKWAYNTAFGDNSYDLMTGEFQNPETAGNYISFKAEKSTVKYGESITFWGWYPPLPEAVWPELKLELRDETNTLITTINNKPARTEATPAGQSFYFYAAWDGSELNFRDEYFTPLLGDNEYWVMPMGTLGSKTLTKEQKDTITTMIIRGEVNKADFEVLKKQMPLLTHLDLSAVRCEDNEIPNGAFGNNNDYYINKTISTIILPTTITTIGSEAFRNCTGLSGNLVLPDGLASIGQYAFYMCENITGTIIFPESLKIIYRWAFYIFNKEISYKFPHTGTTNSPIIGHTENMIMTGSTVKVPAAAAATYKAAKGWKNHTILGYFPLDGDLPGM